MKLYLLVVRSYLYKFKFNIIIWEKPLFLIENLSKTCLPNGHWEGFENDRQAGYTDFKMCYTARVLGDVNYQVILDGSLTVFVIYSTYFLF